MKKILSLILIVILCFSLTACSSPSEKQKFYDDYFKNNKITTYGESITLTTSNGTFEKICAKNGNIKCITTVVSGDRTNVSEMYFIDNANVYTHQTSYTGEDVWTLSVSESLMKSYLNAFNETLGIDEILQNDYKKIKFEKTENGIDYVTAKINILSKPVNFKIDTNTHEVISVEKTDSINEKMTFTFNDGDEFDFTPPENVEILN